MNLYHLLAHTTNEQLKRIAHAFGVTAMSPSKRNLLHTLSQRYKDFGFMKKHVRAMPDEAKTMLRGLVFFTSPDSECLEIPQPLAAQCSQQEPLKEHIELLEDKGLLFRSTESKNGRFYMPRELRGLLRALFAQEGPALQPQPGAGLAKQNYAVGMIDAIFHLGSLFQHHRSTRTLRGSLHRKIYERWLARCHAFIAHEIIFNFAEAFCLYRGLVEMEQEVYRPTRKLVEWLSRPPVTLERELWQFFLEAYVQGDVNWQRFLVVLASARDADTEAPPVYAIEDVEARMREENALAHEGMPSLFEAFLLLRALRVVDLDTWVKPLRFAITDEGRAWLQGREIALQEQNPRPEPCLLQPNFQLLAPPTVGHGRFWNVDQIAEFQRQDVFTEFRLTQSSVLNAMRRGWSKDAIIQLLDEYTEGRVPDNVKISLEEWTGKYGQIHMRQAVLVECASQDLADELEHVPDVRAMLAQRISPRHFAVDSAAAKKLFRLMQERGYEPAFERGLGEGKPSHNG